MLLVQITTILFFLTTCNFKASAAGYTCPIGWYFNPSFDLCILLSKDELNYELAAKSCNSMSSTLATINTPKEFRFIANLMRLERIICVNFEACSLFWIRIRSGDIFNVSSDLTWVDGIPVISTKNVPPVSLLDLEKPRPTEKNEGCPSIRVGKSVKPSFGSLKDCDQTLKYICRKAIACPDGFVRSPNTSNCYKVLSEAVTWSEASKRCQNIGNGTHLAMITNAEDQKAISELLNKVKGLTGDIWISGRRKIDNKCDTPIVWKPTEGIEINMTFTKWGNRQPDCWLGTENCATVRPSYSSSWNDSPCNYAFSYLCQQSL